MRGHVPMDVQVNHSSIFFVTESYTWKKINKWKEHNQN